MPLPKRLARFNRSITNRVTRPFAARLGGFAVLHHTGRKSGTEYETPVNAWRHGSRIVVALTYGDNVDWLKNVRAADESSIVMKGDELTVGAPDDLAAEQGLALMPPMVARVLGLLNVDQFVDFPIVSRPS